MRTGGVLLVWVVMEDESADGIGAFQSVCETLLLWNVGCWSCTTKVSGSGANPSGSSCKVKSGSCAKWLDGEGKGELGRSSRHTEYSTRQEDVC